MDTVFGGCRIGLFQGQDANNIIMLAENSQPMMRGQAEAIIPMIKQLMEASDYELNALGLIMVNQGPGSYTGIRVGLAAAQGLSIALSIPVIGIDSIKAFLHMAVQHKIDHPLIALDVGSLDIILTGKELETAIMPPQEAMPWIDRHYHQYKIDLIGNGVEKLLDGIGKDNHPFNNHQITQPDLTAYAKLGLHLYHQGSPFPLEPQYLRPALVSKDAHHKRKDP